MTPILRAAAFALTSLALVSASAAPAFAGPKEQAFLEKHIGTWSGAGALTGAEEGNVKCRLTVKGSGERLSFSGRCTYSGGGMGQSFSGVVAYDEGSNRYVSSASGSGTVAGKKNGNSVSFTSTDKSSRGTSVSTMTLSGNRISVDVNLTDRKGEKTRGKIQFNKA